MLTAAEQEVLAKQAEDVLEVGVPQLWNYDPVQVKLKLSGLLLWMLVLVG